MDNLAIRFLGLGILSSLLVGGCDRLGTVQLKSNQDSFRLTVSAAASLQKAMEEIEPLYQAEQPQEIIYNFASSGSLQRQIEQGAPVDVFISAAAEQMDTLEKQGLILPATRHDLLTNQIVLIVPTGNRSQISDFADLTTEDLTTIALGEPESVPAGRYAQEVLTSYSIADSVNAKAVYGKDVRQVLNYVATGNADAGIVYRSNTQGSAVQIVATAPQNTHSPIIYPIAVTQDSDNPAAAAELVEFLTTPQAQAVFRKYGFTTTVNNEH